MKGAYISHGKMPRQVQREKSSVVIQFRRQNRKRRRANKNLEKARKLENEMMIETINTKLRSKGDLKSTLTFSLLAVIYGRLKKEKSRLFRLKLVKYEKTSIHQHRTILIPAKQSSYRENKIEKSTISSKTYHLIKDKDKKGANTIVIGRQQLKSRAKNPELTCCSSHKTINDPFNPHNYTLVNNRQSKHGNMNATQNISR